MNRYAKFVVAATFAALIAGLTALQTSYGDGVLTQQEIITCVLAFVAAAGVWFVPNDSPPTTTLNSISDYTTYTVPDDIEP